LKELCKRVEHACSLLEKRVGDKEEQAAECLKISVYVSSWLVATGEL
jgi:hypothetical protein